MRSSFSSNILSLDDECISFDTTLLLLMVTGQEITTSTSTRKPARGESE